MSFDRERSIIAQNAGTTAANLLSTIHGGGVVSVVDAEQVIAQFEDLRTRVFEGTLALAGEQPGAVTVSDVVKTFPGATAEAAPSGGGSAGSYKFTTGKYTGKTIAEVDAIKDNRDGGRGYLEYYAENGKQENVVRAVKQYLAAA